MSWSLITLCCVCVLGQSDPAAELKLAHAHLQGGRYAEAVEAYEALQKSIPANDTSNAVRVATGLVQAHLAEGRLAEAERVLTTTLKAHPNQPRLLAWQANLKVARGDYQAAVDLADKVLGLNETEPLARLVRGNALRELGQIDEADKEFRWCVRFYNSEQPTDAETLLILGPGAAEYARWHSASQIFNFLINTLCPDSLKDDPLAWQASQLSGDLLLEKFNRGQGLPEFRAALAINPRAADVLAALGEASFQQLELKEAADYVQKALAVNPHSERALHLQADLELRDGDFTAARKTLQKRLETNPRDQRTLARVALTHALEDGWPTTSQLEAVTKQLSLGTKLKLEKPTRFQQVLIKVASVNPHPGDCLQVLGEHFERQLRFDLAEHCYLAANESIPLAPKPKASLGMLYMRTGRTDEARKLLDKAFDADPYHVRISNMRKVLKLLSEYRTIQTDHFVIRVDAQQDRILGRYMAQYLEEIYPELTQQFGYEPPARTQFEIFSKAKGVSGHQWFSTRMVGLQWIQTIGASTGWIVALTSPSAGDQEFNWALVLKHEFVHILTLQQTHFNCPHWFTEALATLSEGTPRPQVWTELLLERVPAGKLMTLENINLGFQRPETPLDWQMAYCQSQMYARYMTEKYGPDTLRKLLDAYRRGLRTPAAIREVCGVDLPVFEAGYKAYLEQLVHGWQAFAIPDLPKPSELEAAHKANPNDQTVAGQLAYVSVMRKQFQAGRTLAEGVQSQKPTEPYAALAMAELALQTGDHKTALLHLERAYDPEQPHPLLLRRLAQLKLQLKEYTVAARYFKVGTEKDPDNTAWWQGLVASYLGADQRTELIPALERLAELDSNSPAPRLRLARLALEDKDYARAVKYARQTLQIAVMIPEVHLIYAEALAGLNEWDKAVTEWVIAHAVDPEDEAALQALADLPGKIPATQRDKVRKTAAALAEEYADLKAVRKLSEELARDDE